MKTYQITIQRAGLIMRVPVKGKKCCEYLTEEFPGLVLFVHRNYTYPDKFTVSDALTGARITGYSNTQKSAESEAAITLIRKGTMEIRKCQEEFMIANNIAV